jgi:hypothetical protein
MPDEPFDWSALDDEWDEHEREEARARTRQHGLGTTAGRIGLALSEIYEGKPAREVEEAVVDDESGQGRDDEDPGSVVIRIP